MVDGRDTESAADSLEDIGRDEPRLLPESRGQRILTVALLVVLVVATAGVVAVAVSPPETTDPFTEFYLIGADGNASDYPTALSTGETATVVVGISNHEHERVDYRLRVLWNDAATLDRNVTVGDDRTRELNLSVTAPDDPGEYRLRFRLAGGTVENGTDQRLRLWVRVGDSSTP